MGLVSCFYLICLFAELRHFFRTHFTPGASKGTACDAKCVTEILAERGNEEVRGAKFNMCSCLCLKCSKTHLQASLTPKFSRGWYLRTPVKKVGGAEGGGEMGACVMALRGWTPPL